MGTGEENLAQGNSANPVSRRVPWRAVLLSVLVPGLGELYSGRPFRAILVGVSALATGLICLKLLFIPLQPWNVVTPLLITLSAWIFILGDAFFCARRAPSDYRENTYNRWYVYLLLVVLVGAGQHSLRSIVQHHFFRFFKITSESMSPTLLPGEGFVVDERAYVSHAPKVNDIVAFRMPLNPSTIYAKRIVATGGDVLRIRDERVFVNGKPLSEPYVQIPAKPVTLRDDFPPAPNVPATKLDSIGFDPRWTGEISRFVRGNSLYVPQGDFFVMGDNRLDSYDSRYWGFVPRDDILGKVRLVYFSWNAATRHVRWARIGKVLM